MSVVEEIKDKLDVAEYIGRQVQLQKSGRYLKGLCPFHTEKTPSFYVFPDNQRWHCFGCGKGGDLYNFVMEYEGYDFRTALEELARLAGVQLQPRTLEQEQKEDETERLHRLLECAADAYHKLLLTAPQAEHARAYLKQRGFERETIDTFQLGYSIDSWDAQRTHLLGQGFSVEEQLRAGMLVQRDEGGTYDRFRNRLMIPICDRRGRVIAFAGRVLNPEDQPKYMNSPQTALFDKSQVLFGYHLASRAIRDADTAVVVEGYMDVMIPYQAGFRNVVAPMGTALTEAHLKALKRLTQRFILALDPDAAGLHGTLQGLETARRTMDREWQAVFDPHGLVGYEGRLKADIRVMTLPNDLDPDELILQDPQRWEALVASSEPVVRFYFHQLLKQERVDEPKAKSRIVDAMLPLLRDIGSGIEREAYAQEIAASLSLDPRSLLDQLRAKDRVEAVRRQAEVKAPAAAQPSADLESYALKILLRHGELLERIDARLAQAELDPVADEDFEGHYRLIWDAWRKVAHHPELDLEELLPPELYDEVQGWSAAPLPEMTLDQWERDLARVILRLRQRRLQEVKQELDGLIREAQTAGDLRGESYARSLAQLSIQMRRLQHALAR